MSTTGALGKFYEKGETIISQGDTGNCMYVIQIGKVEVFSTKGTKITTLAELGVGDFFGEMSIFEKEIRSASVRALEPTRVITVDKKTFLRRIQEDPSLAFRIVETLSKRLRKTSASLAQNHNQSP